jgi:hypothetical protein
MPTIERGSLTKEPPLSRIDATISLIQPNMTFAQLRAAVARNRGNQPRSTAPHSDAPGLLRNRYLLLDDERIVYDRFLSLVEARGIDSPVARKVMYFVWAWRDDRIRDFITTVIADTTGRWDARRIVDKSRFRFFNRFGQSSSATKIRSNYEFFLTETGIYRAGRVNLDLSDGWLAEAMLVASQHEPDAATRAAMLRGPVDVLFQLGLSGLANLTQADRAGIPAQPVPDFVQDEPDTALATIAAATPLREWANREIRPALAGAATAIVNLVALERANASHLLLERLVANALADAGLTAKASDSVDMLADSAGQTLIFEMKSCTARNFHGQIRRAVSQLLEYRFLYRDQCPGIPVLAVVTETEPPPRKRWLREYLNSLGIALVWKEHGSDRLLASGLVPSPLHRLVAVL